MKVELANSKWRKLGRSLHSGFEKPNEEVNILLEVCSCFIRKGVNTTLKEEILSYASKLKKNEEIRQTTSAGDLPIKEEEDEDEVRVFLCSLNKELIQSMGESIGERPLKSLYKVVLSWIVFNTVQASSSNSSTFLTLKLGKMRGKSAKSKKKQFSISLILSIS